MTGPPHFDIKVATGDQASLKTGASQIVLEIRQEWQEKELQFKFFNDGITNTLLGVYVDDNKSDMILIRVHGEKTELFINRETEIRNVQILSDLGIAAKLYGTFLNGIAYEFIPGDVLTSVTVSSPDVFPHVASAMAAMHKAIPWDDQPPCLWKKLNEFCALSPDGYPDDPVKDQRYKSQVMSKRQRQQEIESLEALLKSSNSPIVFCHNDALLANIILKSDKKVSFIDFEYADFNYQAFDIADHFCEFTGVGSENLDFEKYYPKRDFQMEWLRSYMQTFKQGEETSEDSLEEMYALVNKFSLCVRQFWGNWALVQAQVSTLDFDFLGFATLLLKEYETRKEEFLNL